MKDYIITWIPTSESIITYSENTNMINVGHENLIMIDPNFFSSLGFKYFS